VLVGDVGDLVAAHEVVRAPADVHLRVQPRGGVSRPCLPNGCIATAELRRRSHSGPTAAGIAADHDEWEYVGGGDTGVALADFCDALRERGEVTACAVVGDRAYSREEGS